MGLVRVESENTMNKYTLSELEAMPTIMQGHFDNLKVEGEGVRVWLSRMTEADGMEYNNQVSVEVYIKNTWETVDEYEAESEAINV